MDKQQPHDFKQKAGEMRLMCECGKPYVHRIHSRDGTLVRGVAKPEVTK